MRRWWPMRGVVTGVEAEPGQVVGAGTPVVRLAHDGPRDAVFSVPEDRRRAAPAARPSRRCEGAAVGRAAQPVKATVREVAAAADPVTRTFLVKADMARRADAAPGPNRHGGIAGPADGGVPGCR